MWPSRSSELQRLAAELSTHAASVRPLPGASTSRSLDVLAHQFVASLRREDYYRVLQKRRISAQRADPRNANFDAERAVAYYMQQGNVDEAAWLLFLMTHFGRPATSGWRRLQDVYGGRGTTVWDWETVSTNPPAFVAWVAANWMQIRGKFGNHRKYETLRPGAARDFESVVSSYIAWVGPAGPSAYFAKTVRQIGNNPQTIFDALYRDMQVSTFGRLAKFDYLALLGRYGVAPVQAGSAYLAGATGPANGARLLFDGNSKSKTKTVTLQHYLNELDQSLLVGMTVMEDALCNWQKSPTRFVHFRG